jgi:hypothetical protein
MFELAQDILRVVWIGAGATVVLDLWVLVLKRIGIPTLNFAFIGRWIGHLAQGQWAHDAIAKAQPVKRELALGWFVHYVTGIGFAALLVAIVGKDWTAHPTLIPAICFGIATLSVPFFVTQPAMGAGIASSRTATPAKNRLRSLSNHAVFGLGLYIAARLIAWISR